MSHNFHRFEPSVVRSVVPHGVVGVYQLARYENGQLIIGYVGRSDSDLQKRLAGHNLMYAFDYFWFHKVRNPHSAFLAEAGMWHALKDELALVNKAHPAVPGGKAVGCPYCRALAQIRRTLH